MSWHPATDANWSDGRGIHLAKEMLGSRVDINQGVSVYRLGELRANVRHRHVLWRVLSLARPVLCVRADQALLPR